VDIDASLPRQTVFVGESIPVDITLHNRGATTIEVGDRGGPIRFELRDAQGQVHALAPRRARLSPVEMPVPEPIMTLRIEPGRPYTTWADLAQYAGETIVPGSYEGHVRVGEHRSEPFSLVLEAPRIMSPSRCDRQAAWITDGTELFVRDGYGDPDGPVAVRALSGVAGLSSVAVAEGCFAVLIDGAINVCCASPRYLLGRAEGGQVLKGARLVEGRMLDATRTGFVVANETAAQIVSVTLSHDSPLSASSPRDLIQGPVLDVALPPSTRTLVVDRELVAVWSHGAQVLTRALVPGAETRTLLDRGSDVRALNVASQSIAVLLDGAQVHVDLAGTVTFERALPPVPAGTAAWAIGSEVGGAACVRSGTTVLASSGEAWSTVVTVDDRATCLGVVTSHWPRAWVQWLDPTRGFRHAPIER
jgi:hypothetical protein